MRLTVIILMALAVSSPVAADPRSIAEAVRELQATGQLAIADDQICASEAVVQFYDRRSGKSAWSRANRAALIAAIRKVPEHGLDPGSYHLRALTTLDPARIVELDLLSTDAFLLLGSHLGRGVVDPESLVWTWCLEHRDIDVIGALETALEQNLVAEMLARIAPRHPGYDRLRMELTRYRASDGSTTWPTLSAGPSLRLGDSGPRVDQLIARLVAAGLLEGSHAAFDGRVDYAVRRFQHLHGLDEDGIVGPRTLRELNVSAADRIRQIERNLERWRWLPSDLGDPHLLVNIPEFTLRVVEKGRTTLLLRIVVGTEARRTPVFSAGMTQVIMSPYWNVPSRIAREEVWPKARRDSSYLSREHFEVTSDGRIRQKPGPWNALGLYKFVFPNRYDVYLHDTPSRHLFGKAVRTFSHGCMRVEQPLELAHWLLRFDPQWTRERILEHAQTGQQQVIHLPTPLDVHVLYWTAYVHEDGDLHFAPDVYEQDAALATALEKGTFR